MELRFEKRFLRHFTPQPALLPSIASRHRASGSTGITGTLPATLDPGRAFRDRTATTKLSERNYQLPDIRLLRSSVFGLPSSIAVLMRRFPDLPNEHTDEQTKHERLQERHEQLQHH